MQETITIIVGAIVTLGTAYIAFRQEVESRKIDNMKLDETIMLLMRMQINDEYDKWKKNKKKISQDDFDDLTDIFKCYKAHGGNHHAERKYEEIKDSFTEAE